MADVSQMGGKGQRANRRGGKSGRQRASKGKTRKGKVKGYGVDRLRTAAERRMAENSEELAESLMSKAIAGKLESVKILLKLAEEEKARREEEKRGRCAGACRFAGWLGGEGWSDVGWA